jgi:ABC-type uncharacterized transport system involved in gliding motility auxiliary subunit
MADASQPSPTHRASERRTATRIAASASSLFLLAILGMVNYLGFRHYQRFDWTSQGLYTLSPKSKTVLRDLSQDVDVYVFLSRGESGFLTTDELLKRYAAASNRIHLHYVDPDREASQFKLLAQRFGVAKGTLETGEARADVAAVVAIGDKNWHVGREDLVASELGGTPGLESNTEEVQLKGEQALTGAIVQVTSGRATKLCVTQGHGEWTLDESGERSLSSLKQLLRHDNIEWEALTTLGQSSVASGCDAVFVPGPVRAVSDAEAKLLIDHVRAGGNVLLALDPIVEHDSIGASGFEGPLRELGIRLDPAVVIEPDKERRLSREPVEFVVTDFGDHVTTRPLQHAARVLLALARSVTSISQDGQVDILMRTSEQGFAKTNLADIKPDADLTRGPADIAGPVSLAVATQLKPANAVGKARGGRLIVIGDSDFLQAPLLTAPELSNFEFASAAIGWLAERPALIDIPPKKIKSGNIVFSQEDLWALFFRVAVLLPAAALILGVAVWLNRRA